LMWIQLISVKQRIYYFKYRQKDASEDIEFI